MQNDLYVLIGLLLGLICALCGAVVVLSFNNPRRTERTTLGDLRNRLAGVQEEMQQAQEQIWSYGTGEEEKARRWRIACTAVAGKAADVLQSCWLGRERDAAARAIYDELLVGLKSVGLEEIRPSLGQEVEENDRRYRIKQSDANPPPLRVSRLVCPGYRFRPPLSKTEKSEPILLEPAQIEVIGEKPTQIA